MRQIFVSLVVLLYAGTAGYAQNNSGLMGVVRSRADNSNRPGGGRRRLRSWAISSGSSSPADCTRVCLRGRSLSSGCSNLRSPFPGSRHCRWALIQFRCLIALDMALRL